MESPPRPKRMIEAFDNLPAFPTPFVCSSSVNLTNSETNSPGVPSMVLQSLSSEPVASNQGPNLCAFVNEVAAQQQQQIDELHMQKVVLKSRIKELNALKEQHKQILDETKSIKRKTFLAQEESRIERNKITNLRDEILLLLAEERHLQKSVEATHSTTFISFKQLYQEKMKLHEEKVKASAYDRKIGKEIADAKSNIIKYGEEKEKMIFNLNNSTFKNEFQLKQKILNLKSEKMKLLGILHRKKKAVQEEEKQIQSLTISIENSQKHVAAQKLRLRSRIGEKRRLMQQFEEEAVALQIEIDDLTNHV